MPVIVSNVARYRLWMHWIYMWNLYADRHLLLSFYFLVF